MEREGQRRRMRFHEALKSIYFPPTPPDREPSLPSPPPVVGEEDPNGLPRDPLDVDGHGQENWEESCSATESGGVRKLTRAQRKRFRKKKLKEAAAAAAAEATNPAQRRRIIGPERSPSLHKDKAPENE